MFIMLEPRDTLVKTLSMVFLNPADEENLGKKIFIQQFLGCGCPDQVVEQAKIRFFTRPLGILLETLIAQAPPSKTVTRLEKDVNGLLKLPKNLKWPRAARGEVIAPARWRGPAIHTAAKNQ